MNQHDHPHRPTTDELEELARDLSLSNQYRDARRDWLAYLWTWGGSSAHLMRPDEERITDGA